MLTTPLLDRLRRSRQDSGALVCVPRLPYHLAKDQCRQERQAVTRLMQTLVAQSHEEPEAERQKRHGGTN